jgi:hypothetical protein
MEHNNYLWLFNNLYDMLQPLAIIRYTKSGESYYFVI